MFGFRNPYADALIVLLIVLLIFGPKRLPGLGKQLGQGILEFKDSITGRDEEPERPAALNQGQTPDPVSSEQRQADAAERRS